MRRRDRMPSGRGFARACLLSTMLVLVAGRGESRAQLWAGYGSDPQHTCQSSVASQLPQRVLWSTPVDLNPPFHNGDLFIHYASPLITKKNTVVITVRSNAGFHVTAVKGWNGVTLWSAPFTTDYAVPPHNWIPVCGSTLVSGGLSVATPGAGGTVLRRANADRATGVVTRQAFYGLANYNASPASYNSNVFICTPITADAAGNLYFGFAVIGDTPLAGLKKGGGGLARISSTGQGSWISAADATGDSTMKKVVYNCAPALSEDGQTVYFAVNSTVDGSSGFGVGYLVALDSQTLDKTTAKHVRLKDVRTGGDALLPDDGSATPTVGPDGDVYFGVLDPNIPSVNNDRGWLLHFSGDLATKKTPGSFGWDDTASIVPAAAVPSYTGTSSYLVLTKYNDYADFGVGTGQNKLAILDPNDTQNDEMYHPGSPVTVMKEVITVLGPTPNPSLAGVREWCINSAAIDVINKCAVVNSEDGKMYRWDFTTNTLSSTVPLAAATGEAYTPTVIGPDGAVYAINRAVLNCCVKNP